MPAIEEGFYVALALTKPIAGLRCYVGEVQCVDERGVRITLVDWIIGAATGSDFYAPWELIAAALVATSADSLAGFGVEASKFQERHDQG